MTLVAYYGQKPGVLAERIEALQRLLAPLAAAFEPYAQEQVHATIVGCEGEWRGSMLYNTNFRALRNEARPMQLRDALQHVASSPQLPLTVRMGGFDPAQRYPIVSRGEHPHARSFSLQADRAVLMGWPRAADDYPPALAHLRRALEPHGVLHKYHARPSDADNDLFFVLGRIHGALDPDLVRDLESQGRALLRASPIDLSLAATDLWLVQYEDPALSTRSSVAWQLTAAELAQLH
jgi:hypothetical protein